MKSVLDYRYPPTNGNGGKTINYAQHEGALRGRTNGLGRAIRKLLEGWQAYAEEHEKRYESPIGDDSVLGPYWAETGLAIKRLMDGDTGGFDAGSLANNITDIIQGQGINTDGYSVTGFQRG